MLQAPSFEASVVSIKHETNSVLVRPTYGAPYLALTTTSIIGFNHNQLCNCLKIAEDYKRVSDCDISEPDHSDVLTALKA